MSRDIEYARITPEELTGALDEIGLTKMDLATLAGLNRQRVREWEVGEEEPPHILGVLLVLLTLPGAMDLAQRYADARLLGPTAAAERRLRRAAKENAKLKRRAEREREALRVERTLRRAVTREGRPARSNG